MNQDTPQLTAEQYEELLTPAPREPRTNGKDHPLTGDLAAIEQDLIRAADMIEQLRAELHTEQASVEWWANTREPELNTQIDTLVARVTELEAQLRLDHNDALAWREHKHQLNAQKLQTSWSRLKGLLGEPRS